MRRHLSIDIETYSSIDLKTCGLHKYVESDDFEIMLISYSVDFGEVVTIDLASGEKAPAEFFEMLTDWETTKHAYNASFEIVCLSKFYSVYPAQWLCTMFLGSAFGYPLGLKAIGEALGVSKETAKDAAGTMLIKYFSCPCKPTKSNGGRSRNLPHHDPEKWALYKRYNAQDVVAEMEIYKSIRPFCDKIPQRELQRWVNDFWVNYNGIKVDSKLCESIVRMNDAVVAEAENTAKQILGVDKPNSPAVIVDYLKTKGIKATDLRAETVTELLEDNRLDREVAQLLQSRQTLSKSSIKKYYTIIKATCKDGKVKGLLQFYGAHTGRWAGRLVQMQNLKRNSLSWLDEARQLCRTGDLQTLELMGEPTEIFSQLCRTAFIPSKDKFVVADFSAIEARVLAWLANEEWVLDAFRNGKDIYCETASRMYGVPVEKHGANSELRQKGKIAVLALGYGGGSAALRAMGGRNFEMSLTDQEITVAAFRKANGSICRFWRELDEAAKSAIKYTGSLSFAGKIKMQVINKNGIAYLTIELPSGRFLFYPEPEIGTNRFGSASVTYMTDTVRGWERVDTYGGKLAENVTQAVARDCLAEAMDYVTAAFPQAEIVMHVHDEIILDAPSSVSVDEVCEVMAVRPKWAPSLPLEAAGFETSYYKKD